MYVNSEQFRSKSEYLVCTLNLDSSLLCRLNKISPTTRDQSDRGLKVEWKFTIPIHLRNIEMSMSICMSARIS